MCSIPERLIRYRYSDSQVSSRYVVPQAINAAVSLLAYEVRQAGQPDPTEHLAKLPPSGGFEALYREGMSLIEEVAAYLDGDGRNDSLLLARECSFVYATESMRLTTRLMQLASWLLLQRAVNEGEITAENARVEKEKVKFSATPSERGGPGYDGLPMPLKILRASAACMVPMMPTSGANTPMVAQRASVNPASGGNTQA